MILIKVTKFWTWRGKGRPVDRNGFAEGEYIRDQAYNQILRQCDILLWDRIEPLRSIFRETDPIINALLESLEIDI